MDGQEGESEKNKAGKIKCGLTFVIVGRNLLVLTLIAPLAVSTPRVHSQVCTNPLTRTPSGNEKRFEFAEKNYSR